jgi:hypothetical protein
LIPYHNELVLDRYLQAEDEEQQDVTETSTSARSRSQLQDEDDRANNNLKFVIESIMNRQAHKLRRIGTVEQYKLYCELCYPSIVGKSIWKRNLCRVGIKTLTTVADEALVALILENNIQEWIFIARGGSIENNQGRRTLYTHGGEDGKSTKKGWSLAGRIRYNTIHEELRTIRDDLPSSDVVDDELKQLWTNEMIALPTVSNNNEGNSLDGEAGEREYEPVFNFDD